MYQVNQKILADNALKYNTIRQRRIVYLKLLNEIALGRHYIMFPQAFSMCSNIASLINNMSFDVQKDFPELWRSGPKDKDVYWYPCDIEGYKNRINCLKRAIRKCDDQIAKQNDD